MLGNFSYCNPTKLYFGEEALGHLASELEKYGNKVALVYGGGSIKKNGIYDEVISILKSAGKTVAEIAGVMPNPTIHKLYEGVEIARKNKVDFILAVGGGSVVDYAKALSVSIHCEEDPWEKYYARFAVNVWDIAPDGKTNGQLAKEGLQAMEAWMSELGLAMHLSEIGVTSEMLDDMVNGTLIMEGGYKVLSKEDVRNVLIQAM